MSEKSRSATIKAVLTGILAALLTASPAAAAVKGRKKTSPKMHPEARRLMSEGLGELQRGEYSPAIASLNQAVRKQGTVSTYFLLGWAHYQRGFKRGSVETADRADAQSAIDAFGMAVALDPKLRELPDASRLYFATALCQESLRSYDKALEAYKTALRLAPAKPLIPLHAARLRLKMKDEDKAMSNLTMAMDKARKSGQEDALIAAVQSDPSFAPVLANLKMRRMLGVPERKTNLVAADFDARGEDMRDSVRDIPAPAPAEDPAVLDAIVTGNFEFEFRRYENAILAYDKALSLDAKRKTLSAVRRAGLYEKIGASYNKTGASEQAIASLRTALHHDPLNAEARYQVALAYAMAGRTALSLRALSNCFTLTTDPAELRRLLLLSRTDTELEAVRDLPGYSRTADDAFARIARR